MAIGEYFVIACQWLLMVIGEYFIVDNGGY